MLSRLREVQQEDDGFTLIELLVVITILGILAGVAVFAVTGLGDKGQGASTATEIQTLRTAEESYCATNGQYGTLADLRSGGFLASNPSYSSVVKDPTQGTCGGTSFTVGQTSIYKGPSSAAQFYAASNTTTPFSFLAQSFSDQYGPVQIRFDASGTLSGQANKAGDTAALFASADEANVNKTIATGDPVAGGSAGTCTSSCAGIGSSKTLYTVGQLVVFSCKAGTPTLPSAANGSTTCAQPANGYNSSPPTDVAGIVSQLNASKSFKLIIADPGNTAAGAASTAPYGLAAYQALTSTAPGGGGLTDAQYQAFASSGQIIKGTNVTDTQTKIEAGAADVSLIPRSFVQSPNGNDQNPWTTVDPTLHQPIRQWAVVLKNATQAQQTLAQQFITYLLSSRGKSVLASYGYDPVS